MAKFCGNCGEKVSVLSRFVDDAHDCYFCSHSTHPNCLTRAIPAAQFRDKVIRYEFACLKCAQENTSKLKNICFCSSCGSDISIYGGMARPCESCGELACRRCMGRISDYKLVQSQTDLSRKEMCPTCFSDNQKAFESDSALGRVTLAYESGWEDGDVSGYDRGFDDGYEKGHEEGCRDGEKSGYDDGFNDAERRYR